ncbi:MAG: histidine phosphatase family protein [Patescibacteria group bacterium]|nr:histidine phosphatase family protein [Patescibacteria group bacterium]
MKWPKQLLLIRHGESTYNEAKKLKQESQLYQTFVWAWNKNYTSILTKTLAHLVLKSFPGTMNDETTALTAEGKKQAQIIGAALKNKVLLPDVIFVSPYPRTKQTLKNMIIGWPELAKVKIVEEERIREQDHGKVLLFNDWKIFQTFYPDQRRLYELLGPYYYRFPQGENKCDVRERVRSWNTTLIREFFNKTVWAIIHHITKLSEKANLERLSPKQFIYLDEHEKPINCGVTIYDGDPNQGKDGRLILRAYNQKLY